MSKELKTLEPSVVLKFVDGLLKRYEGKTDYNIYITKEWLLEIKQALDRLESIDNAEPSEAMKMLESIGTINLGDNPYVAFESDMLKNVYKHEFATIKQPLQSINLLMQELDCNDMETLRKYARCGYEKLNNFKDSKEVKIEIPESSLMDYNPVKQYLKWEDLEFKEETQEMKVLLNGKIYVLEYKFYTYEHNVIYLSTLDYDKVLTCMGDYSFDIQFFNDLHLERVEE